MLAPKYKSNFCKLAPNLYRIAVYCTVILVFNHDENGSEQNDEPKPHGPS